MSTNLLKKKAKQWIAEAPKSRLIPQVAAQDTRYSVRGRSLPVIDENN